MIDKYSRYQSRLAIGDLYPSIEGNCACGCGRKLEGKKRKWFSKECRTNAVRNYFIIKGDTDVIRNTLFNMDMGFCRECGAYSEDWEADHILSVRMGGGGCTLENFQTLCKYCHKKKSQS